MSSRPNLPPSGNKRSLVRGAATGRRGGQVHPAEVPVSSGGARVVLDPRRGRPSGPSGRLTPAGTSRRRPAHEPKPGERCAMIARILWLPLAVALLASPPRAAAVIAAGTENEIER